MRRRHPHVTLTVALTLVAAGASAQTPEALVRRQQLLDQLEVAHREQRHADALQLALQAGEIRMTPSVRMYVAEEHFALGNFREALDAGRLCVTEARSAPNLNNRERIVERCGRIVESVEARTGAVVLRVPDPPPAGLRVWLGQTEVSASGWGVEIPTPAGPVHVEATSGGGTFARDIIVPARESVVVDIALGSASATPPPSYDAWRGPGVAPWLLAGVGAAAAITATALYLGPYRTAQGRLDACANGVCATVASLEQARDANADLRTLGPAVWLGFGVGAAAVIGGLTWYFVDRARTSASTRTTTLLIVPRPGGATVGVGGWL